MNGIGTKTLKTDRLILRRMKKEDAIHIYHNWASDEKVCKYVTWDKHSSIEVTNSYVDYKLTRYDKEYCFDWVVVLKETNEPIGEIEAIEVSKMHRLVEIGYCYGSKFWNKGYASEALKAVISYMFNEVNVDKILACHISTNPASGKVMKKAGMHLDANLKDYFVDKNTNLRADKVCYSIDKKEMRL